MQTGEIVSSVGAVKSVKECQARGDAWLDYGRDQIEGVVPHYICVIATPAAAQGERI